MIEKYHFSCSSFHEERIFLFSNIFNAFMVINMWNNEVKYFLLIISNLAKNF